MRELILYIHGQGGTPAEAAHYQPLFPDAEVVGLDYHARTPQEARAELPVLFDALAQGRTSVTVIANSIGAYFAMTALHDRPISQACFLSPVVDMERLILDMMTWAGLTEAELRQRGTVLTDFGQTLSWDDLTDVRAHPVRWSVPTRILYASGDHLIARATVTAFAQRIGADLTVMEGGEHWFHTEAQMAFLDRWLTSAPSPQRRE